MQRIAQFWKSGTKGKLAIGCGGLLVIICLCGLVTSLIPGQQASEEPTATQVVTEVKPTITAGPTDTPSPTNTIRPTNTPKPTNTQEPTNTPEAINTPEPKLSQEELGYLAEIIELSSTYETTLVEFSNLFEQAGEDITLMLDDDWRSKMVLCLAILKSNYTIVSEMTPPAKFSDVHADVLKAAECYNTTADLVAEGIDEFDAEKISLASEYLLLGNARIDSAAEKMKEWAE